MASLLAGIAKSAAPAIKGFAQTQGKALLNQGKKQAMNFTMAHKNQARNMALGYLKNKAGAVGRAANARVNQALGIKKPNNNIRR